MEEYIVKIYDVKNIKQISRKLRYKCNLLQKVINNLEIKKIGKEEITKLKKLLIIYKELEVYEKTISFINCYNISFRRMF